MSVLSKMQKYCNSISEDFEDDIEDDDFSIKNSKDSMIIGDSDYGKIAFKKNAIDKGMVRCLTVGQSGSGKSYLSRSVIESFVEKSYHVIVLDPEGEYYSLREKYDFIIAGCNEDECDLVFKESLENIDECEFKTKLISAEELAEKIIKNKINVILDLNPLDYSGKQKIASLFLNGILKYASDLPSPLVLFIEEASVFAQKGSKKTEANECMESLKAISKLGRKRGICSFYNTQRITQLHGDMRSEFTDYLMGFCATRADILRNAEYLGNLKEKEATRLFKGLKNTHKFISFGSGFDHSKQTDNLIKFKSNTVKTKHSDLLDKKRGYLPPKTSKVEKWLDIIKGNSNKIVDFIKPEIKKFEKNYDDSILDIVKYFGSISVSDLYVLLKRDDYNLVDSLLEMTLFFKNKKDFEFNDNVIVYLEKSSDHLDFSSIEIVNFWKNHVNNDIFSRLITLLYRNGNEDNSLKELSNSLFIEETDLINICYEYSNLNIIRLHESHIYLNPILMFDVQFDELDNMDDDFDDDMFDEDDEEDDFEIDEF